MLVRDVFRASVLVCVSLTACDPPAASSSGRAPVQFAVQLQPASNLSGSADPRARFGLGEDVFVLIPGGSFRMGSTNGPTPDERPVHAVTISRSFYMQKTEVTQAQWQAVMDTNPSDFTACGPRCPVEQVSWDDVQLFLGRLNQTTLGVTYRLPTEAEWEYAARAGTVGDFGGTGRPDEMGWYDDNSGGQTHAVAQKAANAFGLYDMHGNVWEWVQDWNSDTYYSRSPVQDPQGPASGVFRSIRGGSCNVPASWARSAFRGLFVPRGATSAIGFRLAVTL